jgi:hypothetical protein
MQQGKKTQQDNASTNLLKMIVRASARLMGPFFYTLLKEEGSPLGLVE